MTHPVSPMDVNHALYGNFIGLQYVFETSLDTEFLGKAIAELTKQFPALSGRYNPRKSGVETRQETPSLTLQNVEGSVRGHARIGVFQANREVYIKHPSRREALTGRAPLSTFTLTCFAGGGSIFGLAINHMLTDATGFHILARRLADIYSALQSGEPLPDTPLVTQPGVFEFGTGKTKKETLGVLEAQDSPKPVPIKGLIGGFVKSMIIRAMEKIAENRPVVIHFNADDVARLKETVLAESGEDWISTNMALSAHFTQLIAKLSYDEDIKTTVQLGQLLDVRGRYFNGDSEARPGYIGNAILIHIDKAGFPRGLQNTPRGELARYYKNRQTRTDAADVKQRLDLLADCLRHGYSNPGLEIKNPIIALNNQSKMPVYDLGFGEQKPLRVIPQDVGDNIMFFPAPDGGIEIYIRDIVNPHRQQELLTPDWQAQLFDF